MLTFPLLSFLASLSRNQICLKSAKKHSLLVRPFLFFFFSALRKVDYFAIFLSQRERNTLLAYRFFTFLHMYYKILLLMTDEYTELI